MLWEVCLREREYEQEDESDVSEENDRMKGNIIRKKKKDGKYR